MHEHNRLAIALIDVSQFHRSGIELPRNDSGQRISPLCRAKVVENEGLRAAAGVKVGFLPIPLPGTRGLARIQQRKSGRDARVQWREGDSEQSLSRRSFLEVGVPFSSIRLPQQALRFHGSGGGGRRRPMSRRASGATIPTSHGATRRSNPARCPVQRVARRCSRHAPPRKCISTGRPSRPEIHAAECQQKFFRRESKPAARQSQRSAHNPGLQHVNPNAQRFNRICTAKGRFAVAGRQCPQLGPANRISVRC